MANGNSRNAVDLYAANLHLAPKESELEFHMRETEQLLEISLLKKKLMETEQAMSRIIADMGSISKGQVSFYISQLNVIVFFLFKIINSITIFLYSAS